MKPPKGPFWAWTDIGDGLDWHLAFVDGDDDSPTIHYPMDGFDDYWYGDDWDPSEIKPIRKPQQP